MNTSTNESDALALAELKAAVQQAITDLQAAMRRETLEGVAEQIEAAQQSLAWGQA